MKINKLEIEFLDHSNRIEREYSQEALKDAMRAWNYAKQNRKKINLDYVLEVHKILMSGLRPDIAGRVRDCEVYIGDRICKKKPEKKLKNEIKQWIKECKQIKENSELAIKKYHIEFEKIHPFEDGNGRVGRILMNIHRLNCRLPILIIHEGNEQLNYYEWFKK